MRSRIGDHFVEWPSARDARTIGGRRLLTFPRLSQLRMSGNTLAAASHWAAGRVRAERRSWLPAKWLPEVAAA